MQFNQELNRASYTIRSYSAGKISISVPLEVLQEDSNAPAIEELTASFIMTPQQLIRNWPPQSAEKINAEHLEIIAELKPEVVLIGTGDTLIFPDMKLTHGLMEQGIGVEVMDTAAACRTYNVLMHEARRVLLALVV
jgi:uncharacterized protein